VSADTGQPFGNQNTMTNPDFKTAIRNQALAVQGETLAGHIQKASAAALRKELAGLSGTGNVRKTARQIRPGDASPPQANPFDRSRQRPEDMAPEALVEEFSLACEAVVEGAYQGIRAWAPMTIMNGVISQGMTAIASPGSIRPDRCPLIMAYTQSEFPHDMTEWARKFARSMATGIDDTINAWLMSINVSGVPLFPSMLPGPCVPFPLSGVPQGQNLLSEKSFDIFMLTAGARVDGLPNAGTASADKHRLDAAARKYVAKILEGMMKYAVLGAVIENLLRSQAPPNVMIASVVSYPGLLQSLGQALPEPRKWSVNGFPVAGINTALREDLNQVAWGAVDAPAPPERPPTR